MSNHPVRRRVGVLLCSLTLIGGGAVAGLTTMQASAATTAPAATPAVATTTTGPITLIPPTRIADSRSWMSLTTFAPYASEDLQLVGRGGIPLTGVAGAVTVITVVPVQTGLYSQGGYLTVWPTQATRPEVSQVSFTGWQNTSTEVIAGPLDSGGSVRIFNGSPGYVDVLVDVSGYIAGGTN